MGRAERLVQVEVHDVEPGLARPEAAEDGVEVRAVHVADGARLADRGSDLVDLVLEDAERAGVRDHQRGDVRPQRGAQRGEVDPAALVRADGDRLVTDHGRRGRVRAVGAVGDEHLRARLVLPVGAMEGTRHEQPRQLPVRASRGLQAHRREAADLLEQLREQPHELQAALAERLGIERV
jgi:hypothetical protein